jgi:hypothetical protein
MVGLFERANESKKERNKGRCHEGMKLTISGLFIISGRLRKRLCILSDFNEQWGVIAPLKRRYAEAMTCAKIPREIREFRAGTKSYQVTEE